MEISSDGLTLVREMRMHALTWRNEVSTAPFWTTNNFTYTFYRNIPTNGNSKMCKSPRWIELHIINTNMEWWCSSIHCYSPHWMVSSSQSHGPAPWRSPHYSFNWRIGGAQNRKDAVAERRTLVLCQESKFRFPYFSLVIIASILNIYFYHCHNLSDFNNM
jgi:hypothetical protein